MEELDDLVEYDVYLVNERTDPTVQVLVAENIEAHQPKDAIDLAYKLYVKENESYRQEINLRKDDNLKDRMKVYPSHYRTTT